MDGSDSDGGDIMHSNDFFERYKRGGANRPTQALDCYMIEVVGKDVDWWADMRGVQVETIRENIQRFKRYTHE